MTKDAKGHKDKLDPRILTAVLILSIVEYEVFTFSKTTVSAAKQDAWLAVILGALIGIFFVFLFMKLAARFPGMGYFQYLQIVWGKPLGLLFTASYLLFWLVFLVSLFYEVSMANRLLFLPRTPSVVPLTILAIALIWLITYGITPIVRFFQLMLPFLLIPLLLLAILFLRSIHIENFQPLLGGGLLPILKGALYFLGAYQGPEVLLFLTPFITQISKGTKAAVLGYAVPSFIGWSNTTAALGILGAEALKEAVLPGIHVVTLIELPGFPVERFGLLLTLPWLVAIFTTIAIYLYLLSYSVANFFSQHRRKLIIFIFTVLPLIGGLLLPDQVWHETLRNYITLATPFLVYLLPILTLCLAIIRKKGATANEN